MFSTTTIVKNSKFSGKIMGTHQKLDQAARRSLARVLPRGKYFPSEKEILHFEGSRGPDGLKRKSPGIDEPSHMMATSDLVRECDGENDASSSGQDSSQHELDAAPDLAAEKIDHSNLDERSVVTMILDHRWNLVKALKDNNQVRAAFEAAWMAHMLTDGLTPAHHFPLSQVKDELMTDKEIMRVFGQPIKGVIRGRNMLETMRNNWLFWGAGGHMSKHIAYEYGVLMIATPLSPRYLEVELQPTDLQELDTEKMFRQALGRVQKLEQYSQFLENGWTTELAMEVKEILLPEIIRAIALGWYSAVVEAYKLKPEVKNGKN